MKDDEEWTPVSRQREEASEEISRNIQEEIAFHLEGRAEQFMHEGMSEEQAQARAKGGFGDRDAAVRDCEQIGRQWLRKEQCLAVFEAVFADIRVALRVFRRDPLFIAAACLCLAIGIAVNSAMFTILHELVIDPLPFAHAKDLVAVGTSTGGTDFTWHWCSGPDYRDWLERNHVFDSMTALRWRGRYVLGGVENPARLLGIQVTHTFNSVLGVQPMIGRSLTRQDEQPGANRVVLLSHGVWQQHFGGDRNVIGQIIRLDNNSYQVVGVMPARFTFPDFADFWIPAASMKDEPRDADNYVAIGRLKSGISVGAAQTDLRALWTQMVREHPEIKRENTILVAPFIKSLLENLQPLAMLMFCSSCLVLLLACANLANLLLARAMNRGREIAIRGALGASKGRITQQFFIESLMVAAIGGAAGVYLGRLGLTLLIGNVPRQVPQFLSFDMNLSVLGSMALIVAGCAVLFGTSPALFARRQHLSTTLAQWARGFGGGRYVRFLRSSLVVLQLCLAFVVLAATALIVKGFVYINANDPGFKPENLIVQQVSLSDWKYPTNEARTQFYRKLVERARSLPFAHTVSLTSHVPMGQYGMSRAHWVEGFEPATEEEKPISNYRIVDADYFKTLGVPLLRGRAFLETDYAGRHTAIVNQAFVDHWFPGRDPIGLSIGFDTGTARAGSMKIVGVAGNVREDGLQNPARPCIYVPLGQDVYLHSWLIILTKTDVRAVAGSIRGSIRALDPDLGLVPPRTMASIMQEKNWQILLFSYLFGVLAALAILLALIGVFSVVAYMVSQRNREFAIRLAMGAVPGVICSLVLEKSLAMATIGVSIGLAATAALGGFLRSIVRGVSPGDPLVYGIVFMAMICFTLLVSLIPARRAARINPVLLLKDE